MPRLSPVHSFSPVTIENRRTATFPGEDDFGQHNLGYSSSDPGGGHPAYGRPRMNRALVGFTGFVGGNLVQQMPFDVLVNSGNSEDLRGCDLDLLVFAGAYAEKWRANQDPKADRRHVDALIDLIRSVTARRAVLISTIDVYGVTRDLDEMDSPSPAHPYGLHRADLEEAFQAHFRDSYVTRLPALFGHGLQKNAVYDLLHSHRLEHINPDSEFQFYDLRRLGQDLAVQMEHEIRILNLFTEPVAIGEVVERFFRGAALGTAAGPASHYDLRTRWSHVFQGPRGYVESREDVLERLGAFIGASRR